MKRRSEAGQALVSVAFGMLVLCAVMGFAIDIGYLRYLKRQLQTAADSAAIAGAAEANPNYPFNDVTTAAKADAAANGFTDGSSGVTVTVNNGPASGPDEGTTGYVEVLIAKTQPTFFMRVVPGAQTSATVSARAVAHIGSGTGCLYSLGTSPNAVSIGAPGGGASGSLATSCGVIDNGDFTFNGTGDSVSASEIGVSGTVNLNGATVNPAPHSGMVSAGDPLFYLQSDYPSTTPCDPTKQDFSVSTGNWTLNPGIYCGGIRIATNANVTFNPGLYVLTKSPDGQQTSGLWISDYATVTGNGVTFYNASDSSSVDIVLNNSGSATLSAPTAPLSVNGTTIPAGVLIFQNVNNTAGAVIQGGNNPKFEGTLYFPDVPPSVPSLTLEGIGSAAAYTIVVAGSVNVQGNNTFKNNYGSLSGGSPIKDPLLTE